jgi:hypothetical protein
MSEELKDINFTPEFIQYLKQELETKEKELFEKQSVEFQKPMKAFEKKFHHRKEIPQNFLDKEFLDGMKKIKSVLNGKLSSLTVYEFLKLFSNVGDTPGPYLAADKGLLLFIF